MRCAAPQALALKKVAAAWLQWSVFAMAAKWVRRRERWLCAAILAFTLLYSPLACKPRSTWIEARPSWPRVVGSCWWLA